VYQHKNEARKGTKTLIYNAIRKYKEFKAEVICCALNEDFLCELEKEFIKDSHYNLTEGGKGISGFSHSNIAKYKIRKSRLGKSSGNKGKISPRRRVIYCKELDVTFLSVTAASEYTGIHRSHIAKIATDRVNSSKGFTFEYRTKDIYAL
jgi:hypothetical protein